MCKQKKGENAKWKIDFTCFFISVTFSFWVLTQVQLTTDWHAHNYHLKILIIKRISNAI